MANWKFDTTGANSWWNTDQLQKGNKASFGEKFRDALELHSDELLQMIEAQPNGPGKREIEVDLPGLKGKLVSNGQWIEGMWGDFYHESYATRLEARYENENIIRHWAFTNESGACLIAESVVATRIHGTYISDLQHTLRELGDPTVLSVGNFDTVQLCWGSGEERIQLGLYGESLEQALQSHLADAVRSQLNSIEQAKAEAARSEELAQRREQSRMRAQAKEREARAKRALDGLRKKSNH